MPFVLNPSSGKYEFQGEVPEAAPNAGESPVAVAEEKKPPEKVESNKPWWQQAGDFVGGAIESANPATRYIPNPVEGFNALRQGKVPPSIKRLQNDVQYEVNTLTKSPQSAIARVGSYAMDQTSVLPQDAKNTLKLGGAKTVANATKAALDPIGLGGAGAEAAIDQELDTVYEASGFKSPSQMNEQELGGDDMRASLVLNGLLALATQGASAKIQGSTFLATKFPFLAKTLGFADVTKAKTLLGGAARFTFGQALDELPSTFLDDNTGGSGQQLFALAAGVFNPELGQEIAKSDPAIQPGLTRTQSSQAAFLPNLTASLALGGGLMGLAKGLPATRKAIGSAYTRMRRQSTRKSLIDAEVIVEDEAGKTAFNPRVFETMGDVEEALNKAAAEEKPAAPIPEAGEFVGPVLEKPLQSPLPDGVDPWTVEYDPQILEIDVAAEVIESQLDDVELDELFARSQSEGTAEVLDEISSRNTSRPIRDDVAYESSAAPVSSLAIQGTISDRFSSVSTDTLRSLASPDNSPALANVIKQMTGKDPSTFDRIDVLEGIKAMEAEGRTVMPSRLMGQPMMLISEIEVAPQRFQFKQGIDAKTGRQKGNSLEGVEVWNEDMEGVVMVWTDPMDGKTYVVNGHNRVDKAGELGIPSVPVKFINAPNAKAARAKGAIANIADDKGTVFDAAKYLRDSDITDLSQLTANGMPLKSGLAVKGMALARLPNNIFQDAVDGILDVGKAIALGDSGLDETGMQQVHKALQSRDMTDSTFSEVLQQARSAPTINENQGGFLETLLGKQNLNLMVQKGELAAAIEKGLGQTKRAANNAFKNVDTLEGAGSRIDKAGTKSLADDTEGLVNKFKATKYINGPTSDLLNEGAEQIQNGAKAKVVADRIRRQLIEAAEKTPPTAKVAEEAVEEVAPVVPRKEKVAAIVKQAARKGDVRPPSTPLPESPAVPDVDVSQRADLATLEILDNEARLMDEFQAIDDALAGDKLEAERLAIGYDEMTFEQKKGAGMLNGLAEADTSRADLEAAGRDINKLSPLRLEMSAENLMKWANLGRPFDDAVLDSKQAALAVIRAKGRALSLDKVPGVDFDTANNEVATLRPGKASAGVRKAYMDFYGLKDKAPAFVSLADMPSAPKAKPRKLSEQMRGQLDGLGQSVGKFTRTVDGVMDRQTAGLADRMKAAIAESNELDKQMARKIGQHIDDQSAGLRELADTMQPRALPPSEFVIPKDLSKSAPRYGKFQLKFESDLDRAAYMIRDKAKKSKGEDRMIAALEEQGYDIDEVRALGGGVRDRIKLAAKDSGGGEAILEIPSSTRDAGPQLSRTGPQLSRSGGYDEAKFRKQYEREAERKRYAQEAALLDLGRRLPSDIAKLTQVSEGLGREMVAGLKDAARISGLDPLRIQYLDQVDTRKLFGDASSNDALEAWDPDAARFARENPGDELMDVVDGETNGVFVPRDFPSIHRSMIYLAMGPSLDTRLARKGLFDDAGTPMGRTAYHESFHAVQDWLEMMSFKPGVRADSIAMREALSSDEAVAEMTALVKGSKLGNYQEGMHVKELQAEAFATWYNDRKVRMKAGGVQAAFEKIKKFVNTLRRKWKLAAGKDPSYVDVFELAAAGKIADKGNEVIAKLRPEQLEALKGRIDSNMDAMLPELTDRVHSYLKQKQADFDVLTDKLRIETEMEGC